LRIFTWNVNHRTCRKAISAAFPAGILSLSPDVVVLTEYVKGPDHATFCTALEAGGLAARFHTPIQPGRHNQVLIASRSMATVGTFVPPDTLSHAVSNCLHVSLAGPSLHLLGLRVPMYKSAKERCSYWDWFETAIQPLFAYPTVIIGDLNADPRRTRGPGADHLRRLAAAGWQLPDPDGPGSYTSANGQMSRLDHALVTPTVTVRTAQYIASANGYLFSGRGPAYLSDHAPLVLDVSVPREPQDAA
jgi:exonuclease III